MRRALAIVGLCLLLALSGCSFLPDGSGGESAAPGVEDGELSDSGALLDAHESTLTESGYGYDLSINLSSARDGQSFDISERQRMAVASGADQYVHQVIYGGRTRVVAWGNDSVEYRRVEQGGSTEYSRSTPPSATALTGANLLEPHLTAPYEVVDTEETDGRTLVTLESTGDPVDDRAIPGNVSSVERYDARLVVDGEGRIHRLNASGEYASEGETGSYGFTYELTSAEDPGVERPAWVDQLDE